uniref:protein-tyrosine-phosphatase n=1 Tax=Chelydra serpentina TaxID=8475 RepID=A0A8C3SDP5_CHESE
PPGKKCERYWPLKQEPLQIGPFSIRFPPQEERPLTHFQYVAWPDRGIPDNYSHFLEMIEHVRLTQGGDPAPVCVHCSAGCGRTGVICILEHVRHLLLQQSIPPNFSIFDIVLAMRKQRPSAVQTLEQYEFLYHAVAEMFRSALATTKYENLKEVRGAPGQGPSPPVGGVGVHTAQGPSPPAGGAGGPGGGDPGVLGWGDPGAVWIWGVWVGGPVSGSVGGGRFRCPPLTVFSPPGYNFRIGKPKGPRDPPAEWTRL